MKRPRLALLAVALAACGGNNAGSGAQFHGPVSMAVFNGLTHRANHLGQGAQPYIAVANSRTDDLRLIDLSDNAAVPAPGFAFPLSIPTAPMPIKVAAASLGDSLPDALVVASGAEMRLELVSTWDATSSTATATTSNEVVDRSDLSGLVGPGAQILSMLGLPAGNGAPARILVGVSRGAGTKAKLIVVDFARGRPNEPNGVAFVDQTVPPTKTKDIDFDPVDMALDPNGTTIYCATPDVIPDVILGSIQGVAAIATAANPLQPPNWTVTALKAGPAGTNGKPTRLVAAALVGERTASSADTFSTAVPRVYADLDPSGCGPTREISCGIVTLDPTPSTTTNLAPDIATCPGGASPPCSPVPQQSYRAPFVLPAQPTALAIALPPATGSQRCDSPYAACAPATAQDGKPLLLLAPGSGQRWTTAAMVVGASDGVSYVIDLGRSSAADDVSLLNEPTRAKALNAFVTTPAGSAKLGLHVDYMSPKDGTLTTDPAAMAANILVTPGYTRSDTWAVTWQGGLPGLINRTATLTVSGGNYSVALAGPGVIDNPMLGVQSGDLVQVIPTDASVAANCPSGQTQVGNIDTVTIGTGSLPLNAYPCTLPNGVTSTSVTINVFAAGLVLTGTSSGYAGRPVLDTAYSLAWTDDAPGSALQTACAAGNRQACIDLAVARKARRFYYSGDPLCAAAGCYPSFPQMVDPLATGPALVFRVGQVGATLQPGASLTFSTQSGVQPMARAPSTMSLPSAALAFDRSGISGTEGMIFYVTYLGDSLMEFPTYGSAASVGTIR